MSPRGRPRQFDADEALESAMQIFWTQGYTGTSLDDLARATGLQRPSLYNAFGNKKAIYRQALHRFAERMRSETVEKLQARPEIREALLDYYHAVLEVYFDAAEPQGCFYFCTATAEAAEHADIREELRIAIRELDEGLALRFRRALDDGQLAGGASPKVLAALAQALQHSLSIRARAGEDKNSLRQFARESIEQFLR